MTSATGDFEFEKTLLPRNAGAAARMNAKDSIRAGGTPAVPAGRFNRK